MQIRDVMNTHVIAVSPEDSAASAARLMARHNIGALPVNAADGSLCGMITDRDLVMRCVALDRTPEETTVARIMTNRVVSIPPTATVGQAADRMAREQVRRLPVVEGRRLVGLVTLGDLSHRDEYAMDAAEALSEITANIKQL